MGRRLKRDELAEQDVVLREECIKAVIAWPKRTSQRAAAVRGMMRLCNLTKSRCYSLINDYEAALAAGQDVKAVLRRPPRKDAGAPRAGGEQLRRDAAFLAAAGVQDLAAQQAAEAERAARELQGLFVHFAIQKEHCSLRVPMLRRLFCEQHPNLTLPHNSTLRRWLKAADPALTMTRREALRDKAPRGRVIAREPNHLWLADQHICDAFCWHTDPETGDITPRRPTLFHYLDRYTGLPMGGFYGWSYSSEAVAMALWEAIRPDYERNLPFCGLPEHLYWDRGEQHWSEHLVTTCASLGIETHKGAPYEWAPHGFIEGMHRIIHDQFEALLPGFCGSDNKEEELPLPWRLFRAGEGPCPEFLTLEELNQRWYTWRVWLADQPYRDGKFTRRQLYDLHITPERAAYPSWEALPLAIMRPLTRVVNEDGAVVINHLRYQGDPLHKLKGERVQIRCLPGHMSHIWVVNNQATKVLGVVPLSNGDVFGENPSLAGASKRAAASRREVRRLNEVKDGLAALAGRGEVSQEEADQATGVLTRLQAVAKRETTTVEALAAAAEPAPENNVVALSPRRVKPEERRLNEPVDPATMREVLAGAKPAEPAARKRSGSLFDV